MAETAISTAISLIEKAIRFLCHEVKHTFGDIMDGIKTSLTTMQACLQDAEQAEGGEVIKDLIQQIRNVALEIEDVLDEFMRHASRHVLHNRLFQKIYEISHNTKRWIPLHRIQSKMQNIRRRIREIETSPAFTELLRRQSFMLEASITQLSQHHSLTPKTLEDDEILGVHEIKENILNQLINNHMRRRTVAVVGPPGSGKTVLVNNLFRSKNFHGQFECSAWLNVSPSHSSFSFAFNCDRSRSLLAQFQMGRDEREVSLAELGKCLRGKRYLVVVDDIRNEQQWRCVEHELPKELNGSRIIVTTINSQVAVACAELTDHIHKIEGLGWKESWLLFCQKAFKAIGGECPLELVDVAQKIVKRCEGIPILIVAAASLLSRRMLLPAEWEKAHDNLGPEIGSSSRSDAISNMLLRNYKELPSYLKSCFLYFSIFPEDYAVGQSRLIRLWVAEGFVKETGEKTLEETAEDYLNELIHRNLVHASSTGFDGRVRSCRVLNLVREFAIIKAQEENFATVVTESNGTKSWEKLRRLSIHNLNLERINGNANLSRLRTLSAFGFRKDVSREIKGIYDEFELLKVLDLHNAPINQFPGSITKVVLLRYLSLRGTNVRDIPMSIHELHYLEYLDLKHTHVTVLPDGVCTLQKLRHLLVYCAHSRNSINFDNIMGAEVGGSIGALHSLQKLTLIKAKNKSFVTELGHLEQLQKLGLIELRKEEGKHLCQSIMKMRNLSVLNLRSVSVREYLDLDYINEFPSNLKHLYLKGRLLKLPRWINQSLSSVVKIQLKWSMLNDSPTEVLQVLPNLMELHMTNAYLGEVLIFETGSFQKLRTLHIEQCSRLDQMGVYDGAMPMLQKLTVVECPKLTTLPLGIERLTCLKELLVYDMPSAFTSRLEKGSEYRDMINHIADIRAYTTGVDGSFGSCKVYS